VFSGGLFWQNGESERDWKKFEYSRWPALFSFFCSLHTHRKEHQSPLKTCSEQKQFPIWTQTQLSPDKKWVAYTLQDNRRKSGLDAHIGMPSRTHSGVPAFVTGSDVWLSDLKTGRAVNLTRGQRI